MSAERGRVALVGAGPGDPRLITVRGLELLREADVVVHDRLVSSALLDEVRPRAVKIFAGKSPGGGMSQETINRLLIHHARLGRRVVRLKGGDPFVFGRGGEEALVLAAAAIPFEIVPGVSSAVGVPAYAGIPLTHRTLSSSFAVVTGSEDPEKPTSRVDWAALATAVDTLLILMPTRSLLRVFQELRAHGRDPDTPVAIVSQGTTPTQTIVVGTLASMPRRLEDAILEPPVLVIVGDVVELHDRIGWVGGSLPPMTPHRVRTGGLRGPSPRSKVVTAPRVLVGSRAVRTSARSAPASPGCSSTSAQIPAQLRALFSQAHDSTVRRRPWRRRSPAASPSGRKSTTAIRVSPSASM